MKIVKKISVCWKIQNTQITSLPPLKKKKIYWMVVGRGEIPKLLKFSKFLTRIQIKNQSN